MIDLCCDIGYGSIYKHGEELCGDHVEVIETPSGSTTIVLADGMGSGVKANILATLTAKMFSTMVSQGLEIRDCVQTVAKTLPICKVRNVAYSTFTILNIAKDSKSAEIIQFDNPSVILFRDGESVEIPYIALEIDNKKILTSKIQLYDGDLFILMSDGCVHAGVGKTYNFGWQHAEIVDYMHPLTLCDFSSKMLNSILINQCNKLYGNMPGDDATACTIKIKKRQQLNLIFGPPSQRDDCDKMMSLFFAKNGKHIICGGTTSSIAAEFLRKPLIPSLTFYDDEIPPIATLDGADLVTEGVITINKVLAYAQDYMSANTLYEKWSTGKDGASLISRLLFEESTDINFFVGRAINPAHQNPDLPINFNIKMQLIEELADCLKKIGKRLKISYF